MALEQSLFWTLGYWIHGFWAWLIKSGNLRMGNRACVQGSSSVVSERQYADSWRLVVGIMRRYLGIVDTFV